MNKYKAKLDPRIIGGRYDATKDLSTQKQKPYFAKAVWLEKNIKQLTNGQPSISQHFYIAFAESYQKVKTNPERSIIFTKWSMRGLDWWILLKIAKLISESATPELQGVGMIPATLSYWSFKTNEGIRVYDFSGSNYDGVLINGVSWIVGKIGTALEFDGTNQYVVTSLNLNKFNDNFSLMFWIKNNIGGDASARIIEGGYGGGIGEFGFNISKLADPTNTNIRFYVRTQNNNTSFVTATAEMGKWVSIIAVKDGSKISIYKNGLLVDSKDTLGISAMQRSKSILFGGDGAGYSYQGDLDEVIIFNRVLSDEEIKEYYNLTK